MTNLKQAWINYRNGDHISDDDLLGMIKQAENALEYLEARLPEYYLACSNTIADLGILKSWAKRRKLFLCKYCKEVMASPDSEAGPSGTIHVPFSSKHDPDCAFHIVEEKIMGRQLEQDDLSVNIGDRVNTIFNGELISGKVSSFRINSLEEITAAVIEIEETDHDYIIVPLKFCMRLTFDKVMSIRV